MIAFVTEGAKPSIPTADQPSSRHPTRYYVFNARAWAERCESDRRTEQAVAAVRATLMPRLPFEFYQDVGPTLTDAQMEVILRTLAKNPVFASAIDQALTKARRARRPK